MQRLGAPSPSSKATWSTVKKVVTILPTLLLSLILISVWRSQVEQMEEVREMRWLLQTLPSRMPIGTDTEVGLLSRGLQMRALAGMQDLRDCMPRWVGGRGGNQYGAWKVCVDDLVPGAIIYSFGIGSDVSFDNAMVDAGFEVFGFDPTVTEEHVKGLFVENHHLKGIPPRFTFTEIGLGVTDGTVAFLSSKNPKIASKTSVSSGLTANYNRNDVFKAPVLRLKMIMAMHSHAWVDVLKVDIEGTEFDLFLSKEFAALPTIPADQILIEFHGRMVAEGPAKTRQVTSLLESKGFHLRWMASNSQEALFVRQKLRTQFPSAH